MERDSEMKALVGTLTSLRTSVDTLGAQLTCLEKTLGISSSGDATDAASVLPAQRLHEIVAAVWEEHNDEEYRRDQSHWRGVGRWQDTERWEAVGKRRLRELRELLRAKGKPMAADANYAVLEWGPGGGANLSAIREIASVIYAVDISAKNLKESGRILTEAGFDAFRPVLLRDDMAAAVRQIETPIEVFLSTAVFQHFPTKEYGIQVLKEVFSVMTSGGCGLIQIRYDNGNPKYAPKPVEEYAQRHITATSYAIDEFWVLLQETGFEPFAIHGVDPRVNYATFTFTKP